MKSQALRAFVMATLILALSFIGGYKWYGKEDNVCRKRQIRMEILPCNRTDGGNKYGSSWYMVFGFVGTEYIRCLQRQIVELVNRRTGCGLS